MGLVTPGGGIVGVAQVAHMDLVRGDEILAKYWYEDPHCNTGASASSWYACRSMRCLTPFTRGNTEPAFHLYYGFVVQSPVQDCVTVS